MLVLTRRLPPNPQVAAILTLSLTAQERTRSRYRWQVEGGEVVSLQLPRGTVLAHGDLLQGTAGDCLVRVEAKPEPVLAVRGPTPLSLLRAAYHLGNRHVPVEIAPHYLRLSPDPVLQGMLEGLGLQVTEEIAPFEPERGAYSHFHAH